MSTFSLLILEDETGAALTLAEFFALRDVEVFLAFDGNRAKNLIDQHAETLSAAVLDIMVPGLNGYEVCSYIKNHPVAGSVPVLFLTAKDQDEDQISGIERGAEAYLTKPAGLNLIYTQVKALLQRFPRNASGWLRAGPVLLHELNRELIIDGVKIDCTPIEFELIRLFATHPKRIFERAEILDLVYRNDKNVFDRTVDVHIKNLRLKLGRHEQIVKTVRGIGYGFNVSGAG